MGAVRRSGLINNNGHGKSVISYVGGKSQMIPHIVPIIEYTANTYSLNSYYEACGGGARMLLNLPVSLFTYRSYNDMDSGLTSLFACLGSKAHLYALMEMLEDFGCGEDVFYRAKHAREYEARMQESGSDFKLDIVSSAAYAFIVTMQSRAALMEGFDHSRVSDKKRLHSYFNRVRNLDCFFDTMADVEITCGSCFAILNHLRGRDDAFVYLDPPYYPEAMVLSNHYGTNSWGVEMHDQLVDRLLDIGDLKVALSGYANECYIRLEASGWRRLYLKEVHVSSSATGRRKDEYLWINFDIPISLEEQVCQIDYSAW